MTTSKTSKRKGIDWTAIIVAVITAVASIFGTWLALQGKDQTIRRDLQATITGFEMGTSQPTAFVMVTPTPDPSFRVLDDEPGSSFAFAGGTDPQWLGYSTLSLDKHAARKRYYLDFTLPEQGFGWAGFATVFTNPVNFAHFTAIEYVVELPAPSIIYQIKLVDKAQHEKYIIMDATTKSASGIIVTTANGIQTVYVPLRGNFDDINLEQIKEITFMTNTDLFRGKTTFIISNIHLRK